MTIVTPKSHEQKPVQTAFYTGKIIKPGELGGNGEYTWLDIVWQGEAFAFEIQKRIFFNEERLWVIDRLFTTVGCKPISVNRNGDEITNEWDENDLSGREVQALVYQANYAEIFDFLPLDATEAQKTVLIQRLETFLANGNGKKQHSAVVNVMDEPSDNINHEMVPDDIDNDGDLPF